MGNYRLPEVVVISCVNKGDRVFTIVLIEPSSETRYFEHPPVAPALLTLREGGKFVKVFELHKAIWREGNQIAFETYSNTKKLPAVEKKYIFQSWWTLPQLDAAQSHVNEWSKKKFVPLHPKWDHEHCKTCFERMSEYEDEQHFGYVRLNDRGKEEWLCEKCFNEYVVSGFGKKLGDDIHYPR